MGIKREDKSKLFKLFGFVESTEDMNTRGIGLGLVISKKIVDNFEGNIGFKSQWEKGSNFGFTIKLENDLPNTELTKIEEEVVEEKVEKTVREGNEYSDTENED
jgi:two-component system sensor histidine kinase BarA